MLRVVLSRAARSARRTAHFDLEAPREPQTGEYWCHKHKRSAVRSSRPSASSAATRSTRSRASRSSRACATSDCAAQVLHGDCAQRRVRRRPSTASLTSPPYPGLIDYHEQHRYAYELLGLDDRRELELGAAERGNVARGARGVPRRASRAALANAAAALAPGAPVLVVVNDRRGLYPGDPRARGPRARSAAAPPREPAHRPPRGRVLRRRARRARLGRSGDAPAD